MGTGTGIPIRGAAVRQRAGDRSAGINDERAGRRDSEGPRLVTPLSDTAAAATVDAAGVLRQSSRGSGAMLPRALLGMSTLHLLVVDNDEHVLRAICEIASTMGFERERRRLPATFWIAITLMSFCSICCHTIRDSPSCSS